jgi:hypothetical protein
MSVLQTQPFLFPMAEILCSAESLTFSESFNFQKDELRWESSLLKYVKSPESLGFFFCQESLLFFSFFVPLHADQMSLR